MPFIETPSDLAEWLADQAGIYMDYRCAAWYDYDPDFIGPPTLTIAVLRERWPRVDSDNHVDDCNCRVAWVPWITQRIRNAAAAETRLELENR